MNGIKAPYPREQVCSATSFSTLSLDWLPRSSFGSVREHQGRRTSKYHDLSPLGTQCELQTRSAGLLRKVLGQRSNVRCLFAGSSRPRRQVINSVFHYADLDPTAGAVALVASVGGPNWRGATQSQFKDAIVRDFAIKY